MDVRAPERDRSARPIVVLLPYPSLSGLELFGVRFMEDLRRRGFRSLLACPPGSLLEQAAHGRGLETRPLITSTRWNPFRQMQMNKILREDKPLASIAFRTQMLPTYQIGRVLTGSHAPLHLFYRLGAGNIRRVDPFHRYFFRHTASVIANARHVQTKVQRYWAIDANKVFWIPSGIDTKKYRPDQERRHALRSKLGLPPEAILIGNTGRIESDKGSEDLLEAVFKRTPESIRKNLHLVFVGREGKPGFLEHLKSLAVTTGSASQLHFLPFTKAIEEIYPGLDFFVLPVRSHETYAYVVLEALASEVPVLVPATGGMTEMFEHERHGRFYRHRDLDSLGKELSALLAMPAPARDAMGRAAREHVLKTADWDTMMERYFQILRLP